MAQYVVYNKDSGEIVFTHQVVAVGGQPAELSDEAVIGILPVEANLDPARLGVLRLNASLPSGRRVHVDPVTKQIAFSEEGISQTRSESEGGGTKRAFLTPEQLASASAATLNGAISQMFGRRSPSQERSSFTYLRNARYSLLNRIARADPKLAYLAAAGLTVLHQAACSALRDELDGLLDAVSPQIGLRDRKGAAILGKLLDDALAGESGDDDDPKVVTKRGIEFRRLYDSAPGDISERLGRALADEGAKPKPKAEEGFTEGGSEAAGDQFDSPRVKLPVDDDPFRRRHVQYGRRIARNHHYWAAWTCVEWPTFLYPSMGPSNPQGDLGPGFPLICQIEDSVTGDKPELAEFPPSKPPAVKATKDVFSLAPVFEKWDARVWNYVPSPSQIVFLTPEPMFFCYIASLQIPGVGGYDWAKLGKQLSEKVTGVEQQVLDRVADMLQGAQIGGTSLSPLAKGTSTVKDVLNTIIQQIIEWVVSQLNGIKFPPVVVSSLVVWVQNVPETTVNYYTSTPDGVKTPLPPPPGTPAEPTAGGGAAAAGGGIVISGESQRPDKTPSPTLAQIVDGLPAKDGKRQDYKEPIYYWVIPGKIHAVHAFVAISGNSVFSDPKYWLALRTEVRVVEVEFPSSHLDR